MAVLSSSDAFIRALKAPHDPPFPDGPSKVELAATAWRTHTFYVPGKAELLVDWAFTRLLKDRAGDGPVVDVRYWDLLSSILLSSDPKAHPRPVKSWLPPLLARIPTLPIYTAHLRSLRTSRQFSADLCGKAEQVLSATLSRSLPKASFESMLECFGEVLRTIPMLKGELSGEPATDADPSSGSSALARSCSRLVTAFRTVYTNAGNKRKALSPFVDNHLEPWIAALDFLSRQESFSSLRQTTYQAGEDVLFSLDSLRLYLDDASDPRNLVTRLSQAPPSSTLIRLLPELMTSFIRSLRRYPAAIPSTSGDVNQVTSVRVAALRFFQSCIAVLSEMGESTWRCTVELLRIVERERLYDTALDAWKAALLQCMESVITYLESGATPPECALALQAACIVLRMGYDVIKDLLQRLLLRCVDMGPEANAAFDSCLEYLLDYHSKTRTLPALFELYKGVVSDLQLDSAEPREVYESYASGPLFSFQHQERLETALVNFLTSNQGLQLLPDLNATLNEFKESSASTLDDRPAKRRKVSSKRARKEHGNSMQFALFSRLAAVAYRSVLRWEMDPRILSKLLEHAQDLHDRVLHPLVNMDNVSETLAWSSSVKVAGAFRLLRETQSGMMLYGDHGLKPVDVVSLEWADRLQSPEIVGELRLEIIRIGLDKFLKDPSSVQTPVILKLIDTMMDLLQLPTRFGFAENTPGATLSARLFVTQGCTILGQIGTQTQLERAVGVMLDGLASGTTFARALSFRADFWELASLQKVFVRLLIERVLVLGKDDISVWLERGVDSPVSESALLTLSSVFTVLAHLPVAYLRHSERSLFIRYAFIADVVVSQSALAVPISMDMRGVFRLSAARLIDDTPSISLPYHSLVAYLMRLPEGPVQEALVLATISVIDALTRDAIRSVPNTPGALQSLFTCYDVEYQGITTEQGENAPRTRFQLMLAASLFRTLSLTDAGRSENLHEALHNASDLASKLLQSTVSQAQSMPLDELLSSTSFGPLVQCWSSASALMKQTDLAYSMPKMFTTKIVLGILRSSPPEHKMKFLLPSLFAISVDAATVRDHADLLSAERLCELYLLLEVHGFNSPDLDVKFHALTDTLPLDHRTSLVKSLLDRISQSNTILSSSSKDVLQAITCLLCPTISREDIRPLINDTLDTLCDALSHHVTIDLSQGTIALLNNISSQSGLFLFTVTIGRVWAILSLLLRPAQTHFSHRSVYSGIIVLLTTLVRWYRDSVINCLPQFTATVARLVELFRAPRAFLAPRQASVLENSLPFWIASDDPLTADDGMKLSRLLEGLVVKLPSRSLTHRDDNRQLQSLAKAVSRHAPQMLGAYLVTLADPLSSVATDVRRELEPGMFALCSTLKGEDRDAMMASLSSPNVRVLLRRLWQEYDKQRYVGKG